MGRWLGVECPQSCGQPHVGALRAARVAPTVCDRAARGRGVSTRSSEIRYIDWVQELIHAVLIETPVFHTLMIHEMPERLGISSDDETTHRDTIIAIDHALRDLAVTGTVDYSPSSPVVSFPPEARRFRTESLTSTWAALRAGYLDADDDAFLRALALLSEHPREHYAATDEVDAADVFRALRWDWDLHRAAAMFKHLRSFAFADGQMYSGPTIYMRITYAGLVRVTDDTGLVLREAEDHLAAGRLRASGCVAAVELERRLSRRTSAPWRTPSADHACSGPASTWWSATKRAQPSRGRERFAAADYLAGRGTVDVPSATR